MVSLQEQQAKESRLAYTYYMLYRDQDPAKRSLRALCEEAVAGKKRTLRQIGAWSSKYEWGHRVALWDAEIHREAQRRQLMERVLAFETYIE